MNAFETGVSSAAGVEANELPAQDLTTEIVEQRQGISGAALIAAIAVAMLLLGWLFFYFGLYLGRG